MTQQSGLPVAVLGDRLRDILEMAEDLAATLARHGVAVELSQSTVSAFEIGEEILARARDIDADLLVSGCRVHSSLRESLFGSTTRHLFEHSSRPLLMGG